MTKLKNFMILVETLEEGFIHYELSILARRIIFQRIIRLIGWEKYIGIGPSAHSYDGFSRSWEHCQ
jgi:oxygen-independent coproporphyrinogen-3 oxidase